MGQLQEKYKSYRVPQKYMEAGVYPYFREITSKQGTEVEMGGHEVLMFGSNAYTGLTGDQRVIDAAKAALYTGHIGDGKIFVYNIENVVKIRTNEEGYDALQDD